MNYLAHVYLSHRSPDAIVGAILGDFVKGREVRGWNEQVRLAIEQHRAIDGYTDRHPVVVASRTLISAERRRFAGVLVDIFYDHFLARHWSRYHDQPLPCFTRRVYDALLPQRAQLPPRLQSILPGMAVNDWLASYAELRAVDYALNGIARRLRYPDRARVLHAAVGELERNYAALEDHFERFFPQLREFAAGRVG